MEGVKCQYFQNQHKGLKFGSLNFSDHLGVVVSSDKNADVLNQEVQNLALEDSIKENGTVQGVVMESEHMEHRRYRYYYPLRPEAENCQYFMRHGWCRFKRNCRYNHPLDRKSQADYKEIAKLNEKNLNRMAQAECKGVKECPIYKLNGSCKYGSTCWFDHPDPPSIGEGFPRSGITGWEDATPFWPSAGPVNGFGPVNANMHQPAQSAQYSEWIGYQVPLKNYEAPIYTTSGGIPSKPPPVSCSEAHIKSSQQQQPPKPHRQPEPASIKASDLVKSSQQQQQHSIPSQQAERCIKSGFMFHHTKTPVCPVNDKGLPLRPDTEVCAFYNRYGVCKRGTGCKFDHPVPRDEPVTAAE